MVYDLKKYKKYLSCAVEPLDISALGIIPFLIVNEGNDYIYSKVKINLSKEDSKNTLKRTFQISFKYKNLNINESLVCRIEFFKNNNNNGYQKMALDSGVILSAEDVNDFVLVIYKQQGNKSALGQGFDISIYDSSEKLCELKNVKSLANGQYFNKNKIIYYRRFASNCISYSYDERWVFMNGSEYSENELNLSLSEWNALFKPSSNSYWDMEKLYSPKNKIPFSSNAILWNTKTSYEWQCALGHCWTAPVYDLTVKPIYINYCPVCQEFAPQFHFKADEKHAQKALDTIRLAQSEFKTNNVEEIINLLEEEIAELQEMYDMGIVWFDHAKMPDSVIYYFAYPNGKHGDIDKAICETFGEAIKIEESLYMAKIPTNYYEEIELLTESYANKELIKRFDNDEIKLFLSKHNVMHRLKHLSSMAHQFKMPTNRRFAIDREMTQYRAPLRVKRTEIYNKLVGENKATHKWASEQLLYHLVKSLFPDAVFQYKANWLGNQSLDIFIPSINLGIEYQGVQHYQPIALFGGEDQFKERLILDERKRRVCKENEVALIEWKYTKEINEKNVSELLRSYLG